MGRIYLDAIGVKKDLDKAFYWYLQSANQGIANSEYNLGWILAFEDSKNSDYIRALPWIIKAAGAHKDPQIVNTEKVQTQAQKSLQWMCKKGVVEFPLSHPFSQDPKCWLARGERFYYGRAKLGEILIKTIQTM